MRALLICLLITLPTVSFGQFFGLGLSYIYDGKFGNDWRNSRGFQLGLGVENMTIRPPLTLGFHYAFGFTKSRYNTRIEDLEFDLPDSIGNRMGYALVDYKKFTAGLGVDLGYRAWEDDILEPYVSLGVRYQNYYSSLKYDLYEPVDCLCYSKTPKTFTETNVLGFTTGAGLKIRLGEAVYFDLRATYYGGWGMTSHAKNPFLPETDSFHINSAGEPTITYSTKRYAHGMNFSAGIIVRLRFNSSNFSLFNSDDESSDDHYSSDDEPSAPRTEEPCDPVELKPKGRKDPPL